MVGGAGVCLADPSHVLFHVAFVANLLSLLRVMKKGKIRLWGNVMYLMTNR